MRVFFSAGEASGDAYGAALLTEMRRQGFNGEAAAVGGRRLASAGARMVANSSRWGAVGILESLKKVLPVYLGYLGAKRELSAGAPGLCVPIDFGYVNVRLARHARRAGWKVLYFSPPGAWRRDRQGKDLPFVADEIVTPFPWSAEILRSMGASAHFFGHPLKQMIRERLASVPAQDRRGIAVLPGSRLHEIAQNLPIIAAALEDCTEPVEFGIAPSLDAGELRALWESLSSRRSDAFCADDVYGALARARVAIVCSGTATLEAALCRCPMVVMYRFGRLAEVELRMRRVRPKYISLPNILLDREVVPELIQQAAVPDRLTAEMNRLLADGPVRAQQLGAFEELDQELGDSDAVTRAAELAIRLLSA